MPNMSRYVIHFLSAEILSSPQSVRDPGIFLDTDMSMKTHTCTCRGMYLSFAALRQIRSIRRSVSQPVLSRLPRLPGFDLHRRQWSLLIIVFGQARATVMRATRNGVSPTTNYVTVEKSRQCHTSSTLVH